MGNIDVVLRREDGTTIDEMEDGQAELARVLRGTRDDIAYPYLRFIDPIEDTTFNRQQLAALDGNVDADELTLVVHSPSVTFRTADPLGASYVLSLDEPVADPYLGPFDVQPDA